MPIEQDEKIAKEATQGKWSSNGIDYLSVYYEYKDADGVLDWLPLITGDERATVEYIAHFHPERIKKYIAVVKAAKKAQEDFESIHDGFFTGLVPPELMSVCKALKELEK